MRKFITGLFMITLICSWNLKSDAQELKIMNFEEFETYLHFQNDTTYVINFWAMWCRPCVEELPEFEKIHNAYADKKVKVILVSLDFGSRLEERLQNFLSKKQINPQVMILDDPDANSWIGKVDDKWDGALPGTLIYRKNQSKFFNRKITYKEVAETIDKIRNQTN